MARSKQASVDLAQSVLSGTRTTSSIYQMAANAASLNSTQISNFASMAGKENMQPQSQEHPMKMLSARHLEQAPYNNHPRTDFINSSKTQMLNMKETSQSKLSQLSKERSSDKGQLATLRTTNKKTLEKIPLEAKVQMFQQRCERQIFRPLQK